MAGFPPVVGSSVANSERASLREADSALVKGPQLVEVSTVALGDRRLADDDAGAAWQPLDDAEQLAIGEPGRAAEQRRDR